MMQRFQDFFRQVADRISGNPAPLVRYVYLFFAILAVRLTLEFFSSHRLFTFSDVIHIGLWFMFIVLAFMVQLHMFSGVAFEKVVRLCVVGFSVALTAPLIDLAVSGGQGAKMNYLSLNSWEDIGVAFLTAGGPSLSRGATLGIRIEIGILVLACFNYVFLHTGKPWRAAAGSVSIYTVLFISGAIPRLLTEINQALDLQYLPEDNSTSLFLLTLDLGLLFIVLWRLGFFSGYRRFTLKEIAFFLPAAIGFVIGALMARTMYPDNWTLNPSTIYWFPLLGFIFIMFVYLVEGLETGTDTRPFLALIGVPVAMLSLKGLFICAGLWGVRYLRDSDPLRLGQYPWLHHVLNAMFWSGIAMAGFVFFGAPMVGFPPPLLGAILAAVTGSNLAANIEDRGTAVVQRSLATGLILASALLTWQWDVPVWTSALFVFPIGAVWFRRPLHEAALSYLPLLAVILHRFS